LMLKAFHELLEAPQQSALPVYVNFKLSLKLEPLYQTTPNASFWFRTWLILKIYEGLYASLQAMGVPEDGPGGLPSIDEITSALATIESGDSSSFNRSIEYQPDELAAVLETLLEDLGVPRCVLLLDDAAHAFSPKQQEDFFDFFRKIKSQRVAPKAAIYPGITSHSPSFHVGHDAEQIDVWIRPDTPEYVAFMRQVAEKRLGGVLPPALTRDADVIPFLAYAAFGIPRSLLNMLRMLQPDFEDPAQHSIDRRKILDAAKLSRQDAHAVFDALVHKLPAYRRFIETGDNIYSRIVSTLKSFNRSKPLSLQGVEVGIKRPVPAEISRVIGFFQYAGLMMPSGENSRGIKGVFDIYFVHFADLVTENAIVGLRTKSLNTFLAVFTAPKHQVWPRIASDKLVSDDDFETAFPLSLPACQICGTDRANEDAKFCTNCGAQLKTASIYHQLVNQDLEVLPITRRRAQTIKKHSSLRTIKDMLLDNTKAELRGVPQVGPKWAERIARYAQEYVA